MNHFLKKKLSETKIQ